MRAFGVSAYGTAPGIIDVPDRMPAKGEIRLAVKACGLNFADLLMAEGKYQERPEPPVVLGMEVAGEVIAAGEGAEGFAPGTQVVLFAGSGGLAETGCFPSNCAVAMPAGMPYTDAAGFLVAYGTAHVALDHRARLQPGETLVVLGAAGGVGLSAVEIGRLMGARVIAVARGAERLAIARAAGADHLIDSDSADLRGAIKDLGGADVVFDPVGGAQYEAAFRACRPDARILSIGFASGDVPQIKANHLMVKNLTVMGVYWGAYLGFRPAVVRDSLATLLDWYAAGRLKPHVSHILPLDRTAEGLELLRSRKATGKIVVTI